jgi:SAM-dependent methyltransferase
MASALTDRQLAGATSTTARLDLADLYRYAMRIGLHLLAAGRVKRGLRYLVQPVPYWRGLEYRLVWNEAGFTRGDRILDIGSPKLLSIYLAEKVGAEVFATDIDGYFINEYSLLRSARRLSDLNLRLETQDGRTLRFPADSFDKVYAVSVIEHIPDHGDTECMREVGRVLRPGGMCLLTVPFWPVSKDEYKDPASFYWAGSSKTGSDGRVFFQRRYSEEDLYARLIEPSGLTLRKLQFVGERVLVGSDREFGDFLVAPTGPVHPVLSRLIHTGPVGSSRSLAKPLCAFIVLTKPAPATS